MMTSSLNSFEACVETWGSTGAVVSSGMLTSSLHAFNALVLSVGASNATVNSTFPWHQTSAQGFLIATAQLAGLSTFGVGNVYDVLTHGDLMKVVQSHFLGIASFIGSGLKLYDHAGTSFIGFEITTNERTVTT
jgi:hypothetical protein